MESPPFPALTPKGRKRMIKKAGFATAGVLLVIAAIVDVISVTVSGEWQWPTHGSSDCNFDRAGVGFAVDWGDPNQAGNHVTTLPAPVGSVDVGAAATNTYNPADNEVHSTPNEPGTN